MDFSARKTQQKKITHAIAVGILTLSAAISAAVWSVWVGLLGVIGLTVLVLTLLKPSWFFTAIYPPFIMLGQVPLIIGETTISLERALVIVGGIGLIGGILVTKRLRPHPLPRSVFFGSMALLGTYLVAMVLFPSDHGHSIVLGLYQKAILGYFVFISFREPKELYTVIKLFLAASFIASLFTLYLYFTEGTLSTIRMASYNVDEIDIDLTLIMGLARAGAGNTMALWVAIGMLWQTTNREGRTFWFAAILWFGLLSLFALRREALVTIALGMIWLLWRHPGRYRRFTILLIVLMAVAIVFFIMASPEWTHRLMGETVEDFASGEDPRMTLLFSFTPTAFLASPLIGYGPGNYQEMQRHFSETVTSVMLFYGGIAPHNSWSSTAIEAGAGALIGFCLMLWGIGRPFAKSLKTRDTKLFALWSIAPLLFFQLLMSLFFGDGLKLTVTWFWFGVLLALERMTAKAPA